MTQPPSTRRSPLRGLVVGITLSLILFPSSRHLVTSAAGAIVGVAIGAVVVVAIHIFAGARK